MSRTPSPDRSAGTVTPMLSRVISVSILAAASAITVTTAADLNALGLAGWDVSALQATAAPLKPFGVQLATFCHRMAERLKK